MKKNYLSSWQFAFLVMFPIFSFYDGFGIYLLNWYASNWSFLAIIITYFLGSISFILFFYIFNFLPDKNIYEKNIIIFGNGVGKIINIILTILIFIIGSVLLYDVSYFVILEFLNKTPIYFFMIVFGGVIFFNVSHGIVNIARVSVIFLIVILFLSFTGILGLLPIFDIHNFQVNDFSHIHFIRGGISFFIMDYIPIFLLLVINKSQVQINNRFHKRIFICFSLAISIIILENILMIGCMGIRLIHLYQYSGYMVLQKISLFRFLNRIEDIIYMKWILSSFISISLIVYHISRIVPNKRNSYHSIFIMLLLILFSLVFLNNSYFYKYYLRIIPIVGGILLFVYIFIGISIIIKKINSH